MATKNLDQNAPHINRNRRVVSRTSINQLPSLALSVLALTCLTACQHPGQNRYGWQDVGQATRVTFGTVISVREIEITGQNTGIGATTGVIAGAGAGSMIGSGNGSLAGLLAGAIVAGVAGAAIEQAASDRQGLEYIVTLEDGETNSIVQNKAEGDVTLKPGERVMVQTRGAYQRVLPADNLPEEIARPKKIEVRG